MASGINIACYYQIRLPGIAGRQMTEGLSATQRQGVVSVTSTGSQEEESQMSDSVLTNLMVVDRTNCVILGFHKWWFGIGGPGLAPRIPETWGKIQIQDTQKCSKASRADDANKVRAVIALRAEECWLW